jgi:hypothetical protein
LFFSLPRSLPVMRINAAIVPALYASALLAGTAFAQEEPETETSTAAAERPTFTVRRPLLLIYSRFPLTAM